MADRTWGGSRFSIIDALNAEWRRLAVEESAAVSRWGERHAALQGRVDLADVLDSVRHDPDAVLGALLAEATSGDRVAARTVLQAMLGKLVRMALRDRAAGVDDYVSALWCRIVGYPLGRRPARIAANLALDTLKDVTAARRSGRQEVATPWPPGDHLELLLQHGSQRSDEPELTAGGVLSAAASLSLVDPRAAALLHAVYVEGLSSAAAGQANQVSAEVVRYHCSRAVRRLRSHRVELADAA